MTAQTTWAVASERRARVPDVVAGLQYGQTAGPVARAAVREAVARGARVRFVQAVSPADDEVSRAIADENVFAAALRALRESPRVPVAFESLLGAPEEIFVRRSAGASVLVVGRERQDCPSIVVEYCHRHAECDVLTVAADRS